MKRFLFLGLMPLFLYACGTSSTLDPCEDCPAQEAPLRCGEGSGCDPVDPEPSYSNILPVGTSPSGITTSGARLRWGQACVEEAIENGRYRWTYGAVPCAGGWCSSACQQGAARVDVFFYNSVVTNVSNVYAIPVPEPVNPLISLDMWNAGNVADTCTLRLTYTSGGVSTTHYLVNNAPMAPGEHRSGTVTVPKGATLNGYATCARGPSTTPPPSAPYVPAEQNRIAEKSCFFHGAYFIGSDGKAAAELSTDCSSQS